MNSAFHRFLVLLALLPASPAVPFAADAARPNIVFVLVDDMGYADIGCHGARDIRTPHIDRLAREGVRFSDFYSNAPVCTPTRAAFVTGRWQQRAGLEWAFGFTAEQFHRRGGELVPEPDKLLLGLPTNEVSIARMLKGAGYTSAAFGKWHLGYHPQYSALAHGFDEYFGVLLGHADYWRYNYFDGTHCLFEGDKPAQATGYLTDLLNQRAVDFINRQGRKPFFLYVPHLALHFPYHPPDQPERVLTEENKYDGSRRDYAKMLQRIDDGVGQMLAALEKNGVLDDTLFIFSSDNGGERYSDNWPLFNHKTTLWEGGIRVPCLMRWPARLPRGAVVNQPAITMDLTATILAAAGASPPAGRRLDGINLLPILTGERPEVERTFFWRIHRTGRHQKAVRHGQWKYVQDGMVEMIFNLADDVGERRDLAFHEPEILADLKRRLAAWEAELAKNPPPFLVR
jgi:arylsulfatase A